MQTYWIVWSLLRDGVRSVGPQSIPIQAESALEANDRFRAVMRESGDTHFAERAVLYVSETEPVAFYG